MDHHWSGIKRFGTAPVFITAISTIMGAILFLRFGYAVGMLGFFGALLVLLLGNLVAFPTAMAISELATNKRVEGGGEYFIISRSFGLNIGGTIGISLYLSQAISVAFYVIAFTEAFEFLFTFVAEQFGWVAPRQAFSIPVMLVLSFLILKKGANLGIKVLYLIAALLGFSLLMFLLGKPTEDVLNGMSMANVEFRNSRELFKIFAIVFPAFTGITAGVGLSGDLKNPARSIPAGTLAAALISGVFYLFIIWKLASCASPQELLDNQLIMSKIAIGGVFVIPLGLAASTMSSAIGSVMVAPRTLQALAGDNIFPSEQMNRWLSAGKDENNEPFNTSLVTCILALVFVAFGSVNVVASIITMFFLVTYGALCLISFLNHFGSSPSYRPSFKSKWAVSLTGFLAAVLIMFKIDTLFALLSIFLILIVYLYINHYHKGRQGLSNIFYNVLFQLNRNLQVYLQKRKTRHTSLEWRPSVLCISTESFKRDTAFQLLNWISYKYGFGTYIHKIQGYFSADTDRRAKKDLEELRNYFDSADNQVYIDTLISPSYTSAIAQSIQVPGISGMENNLVLLEFFKDDTSELEAIVDNLRLIDAGGFDIGIIGSSTKSVYFRGGIHIWLRSMDNINANLMILLAYIILGHPSWKKSDIRIFRLFREDQLTSIRKEQENLLNSGRLPISANNIEWIPEAREHSFKALVNEKSRNAGLTMIGFRIEQVKHDGSEVFRGYEEIGQTLFIHSNQAKEIA